MKTNPSKSQVNSCTLANDTPGMKHLTAEPKPNECKNIQGLHFCTKKAPFKYRRLISGTRTETDGKLNPLQCQRARKSPNVMPNLFMVIYALG